MLLHHIYVYAFIYLIFQSEADDALNHLCLRDGVLPK